MRRWIAGLVASMTALAIAACASGATVPPSAATEVTVFAAASLRDALEAARIAYQAETPAVRLVLAFDASSTLRTQIEQGAPADVFLSADWANAEALAASGLTEGDPVAFASNTLVVVTPPDDRAGIATPFDLARPGVRIVAAGPQVPVTAYAQRALEALAGLPEASERFLDAVAANVASREDNARAVAAKIELGEGDAGFVYATDARASGLRIVPLPAAARVTATYAAALPRGSPQSVAAHVFLAWLVGAAGRKVLADAGFGPPP